MSTTIGIIRETAPDENRVALTPEIARKLKAMGYDICLENNAGAAAGYPDPSYVQAGARMTTRADALSQAIILTVRGIPLADIAQIKKETCIIGMLDPHRQTNLITAYAQAGITALTMDFMPRITRAQNIDVLSSQANLAGYRAVIEAAALIPRAFPMMMTAAGTIAPARVFVMGTGVAGLQAIATAKRLGAVVSATDVRPAAREQVQSLGGTFVMIEDEETKASETSGGYAKEMSDAFKAKQAALIADVITKQDIVITTALIPGRPAPRLISEDMVKSMKTGSVIIDMAVEQGGNCALSVSGEIIQTNGITIAGFRNLPSRIAYDASALYARNLFHLIDLMTLKDKAEFSLPWDDDIIKAIALTHKGDIIHSAFKAKEGL